MMKPLPTGGFQWEHDLKKFSGPQYILELESHGSKCYFLEVGYYSINLLLYKVNEILCRLIYTMTPNYMTYTMSFLWHQNK